MSRFPSGEEPDRRCRDGLRDFILDQIGKTGRFLFPVLWSGAFIIPITGITNRKGRK